jgi:hypothetical protein
MSTIEGVLLEGVDCSWHFSTGHAEQNWWGLPHAHLKLVPLAYALMHITCALSRAAPSSMDPPLNHVYLISYQVLLSTRPQDARVVYLAAWQPAGCVLSDKLAPWQPQDRQVKVGTHTPHKYAPWQPQDRQVKPGRYTHTSSICSLATTGPAG